jgi:hypothetical protein
VLKMPSKPKPGSNKVSAFKLGRLEAGPRSLGLLPLFFSSRAVLLWVEVILVPASHCLKSL